MRARSKKVWWKLFRLHQKESLKERAPGENCDPVFLSECEKVRVVQTAVQHVVGYLNVVHTKLDRSAGIGFLIYRDADVRYQTSVFDRSQTPHDALDVQILRRVQEVSVQALQTEAAQRCFHLSTYIRCIRFHLRNNEYRVREIARRYPFTENLLGSAIRRCGIKGVDAALSRRVQ